MLSRRVSALFLVIFICMGVMLSACGSDGGGPAEVNFVNDYPSGLDLVNITYRIPDGFSVAESATDDAVKTYANLTNGSGILVYVNNVEKDIDEAVQESLQSLLSSDENVQQLSLENVTVAGMDGRCFEVIVPTVNGDMRIQQVIVENNKGGITILQFSASVDIFEEQLPEWEAFLHSVKFD